MPRGGEGPQKVKWCDFIYRFPMTGKQYSMAMLNEVFQWHGETVFQWHSASVPLA